MGGGGAMRTVARAAGVGIYNNGIRNVATESFTPARRAATIRSTVSSSSASSTTAVDDVDSSGLVADHPQMQLGGASVGHRALCDFDDWEFAGSDDDLGLVVDKVESTSPRLVFGPSPTIEETTQATSELKDALEKVYISSPSSQSDVAEEAKTCVSSETLVVPSVPKNAMQAFMMLRENPVAETVVASIASDPNVWHAVMQNEALMDYMKSERGTDTDVVDQQGSSKTFVVDRGEKDNYGFMGFMEDMKLTISDWVNIMTDFVKDLFEGPNDKQKMENLDTPTAGILGGSFMALAVMVIMMVVAKRN